MKQDRSDGRGTVPRVVIQINEGWTSNDSASLFGALAEINALIEALTDPSMFAVHRDELGSLTGLRRRPLPMNRRVHVCNISFNSPDIRVDIPLDETAQATIGLVSTRVLGERRHEPLRDMWRTTSDYRN